MEFNDSNEVEEQDGEAVEIYSKKAVWWFSFIPYALFGSILLAINLWEVGYKKAIYPVLAFGLFYTFASQLLVARLLIMYNAVPPLNYKLDDDALNQRIAIIGLLTIALNFAGATIMSRYFFKKHFPDDDYYPKSVLTPLLVAVALIFLSRFAGF